MQDRTRKHLAISILAVLLFAVIGLTWMFSRPSTQAKLGNYIAEVLSQKLGTEVKLSKFCYSFPSTLSLEGLYVEDQQKRPLLDAAEAKLSLGMMRLLMSGDFIISSFSMSDVTATIIQEDDSSYNFQFIIDSLSSSNSDKSPEISLSRCNIHNLNASYSSQIQHTHTAVTDLNIFLSDILFENNTFKLKLNELSCKQLTAQLSSDTIQTPNFSVKGDISLSHSKASLSANISDTEVNVDKRSYDIKDTDLSLADNIIQIPSLCIQSTDFIKLITHGSYDISQHLVKADIDAELSSAAIHSLLPSSLLESDLGNLIYRLGSVGFEGCIDGQYQEQFSNSNLTIDGKLLTDLGTIISNIRFANGKCDSKIQTEQFSLGTLINNDKLNNATFTAEMSFQTNNILTKGNYLNINIPYIEYGTQQYSNIAITGCSKGNIIDGNLSINDKSATIQSQFSFKTSLSNPADFHDIQLTLNADASKDSYSQFLGNNAPEHITLSVDANMSGTDLCTSTGLIDIHTLSIRDKRMPINISNGCIVITSEDTTGRNIIIDSEILKASLQGEINPLFLADDFCSQIHHHLPSLVSKAAQSNNRFDFDATISQSELLCNLLSDSTLSITPLHLSGHIDAPAEILSMNMSCKSFSSQDIQLQNVAADILSNTSSLNADIKGCKLSDDGNNLIFDTQATAHSDRINSILNIKTTPDDDLHGTIQSQVSFNHQDNTILTDIAFLPSQLTLKGEPWQLQPSSVTIHDAVTQIHNLSLKSGGRFINADGIISQNPDDTLLVDFQGFDIEALQNILNFHPVRFGGNMSGHASISQLLNTPAIGAEIAVDSFLFQGAYLGKANINVGWDTDIKGIKISADIIDNPSKNSLSTSWPVKRTTTVRGYVAPGEIRDDIQLTISADNTSASFIHGFLGGVFRSVTGNVNGVMQVTTGTEGVNLIGRMSVDADLQLRATDITYHLNGKDSIDFIPNAFAFSNIHITDPEGNTGTVNGKITHRKLRGLGYDFDIDFRDLLVYDEREFNSDKFMATAHGSGKLSINGKDGYYTNLVADLTPSKASIFSYDAATPDAISKGQFVTFRSRNEIESTQNDTTNLRYNVNKQPHDDYSSDLIFDINIHLTPNCAIRLRMDNHDDGYITAYGNGEIKARYHNKNPFTLNGIYYINEGKYRLYLQDMIFKDLQLQEGSQVSFNGNPFDADIHLKCQHTLPSVPLRDLTSSVEFMQNSNVKVLCNMDITGKLDNMNLGFNIELPNVSDETRQMVKSLISTEEEMNMQMIYLLGLGRFYTNEIARAQGKTGTGSEMSSLVSSTISGQINNMIGNMMGSKSNWNFGTGLSTGEKGWDDLDVEGNLSGRLLNDRLLINGSFGYRDNSLTNKSNFIGDFDIKYRVFPAHNIFIKGYNQTNDKYFTKSTLTTQGLGISIQKDFDSFKQLFQRNNSILIPSDKKP